MAWLCLPLSQESLVPFYQYSLCILMCCVCLCVCANVLVWVLLMDESRRFIILDADATVHVISSVQVLLGLGV